MQRDRCWLKHWRREDWVVCPLCGEPLRWVRLITGEYTPCDAQPALVCKGGRWAVVKRKDLTDAKYRRWRPQSGTDPFFARIPHIYTCSVLRDERNKIMK